MANSRDILPLMEEACERVGQRLAGEALDRHVLLDLATALAIVADMLHGADHDSQRRACIGDTLSAQYALDRLDQCVHAMRRDRDTVPDNLIRDYVESTLHHARQAVTLLRRREVL